MVTSEEDACNQLLVALGTSDKAQQSSQSITHFVVNPSTSHLAKKNTYKKF